MSVIIDGSKANIHWMSTIPNSTGKLLPGQGIFYQIEHLEKLGRVTRNSATGLTPQEAFEYRYAGSKALLGNDAIARDIFVFDTDCNEDIDHDDKLRVLIHELYVKDLIPFDALHKGHQIVSTNSESLIGYDHITHRDTLIKVIKQYLKLEEHFCTKTSIIWRWKQEADAAEILSTLKQHNLCLYAAYTSRGKTKISIEVAAQLLPSGGIVLVTTPISDTKQSFKQNIRDHHFGLNRNLIITYMDSKEFAAHPITELESRVASGELIFIVITVQDARYKDKGSASTNDEIEELREKYDSLIGKVNLWIRDERHLQYGGELTAKRLSNMTATFELDLTATPYNVMDQYNWDNIVSRSLLWGLTHSANTNLPKILIDCINTPIQNISAELASMYSIEEGFDSRKCVMRENGNFRLEAELLQIFKQMYHNVSSKKKNPLSIVNDSQIPAVSKICGLHVFPSGQDGDSAGEYLPALASLLQSKLGHKGTFYVSSYDIEKNCPKETTIGDYIQSLIDQHGRVVILTCGKFLTGTDIPSLGHIVLFDKIENIANFEQILGRMIREYKNITGPKHTVKMYCYSPGVTVGVTLGRLAKANSSLMPHDVTEYDFLDCIPLSEYDITSKNFKRISPKEILSTTQEWYKEQVKSRLPGLSLIRAISDCDLSSWQNIDLKKFNTKSPKASLTDSNGAKVKQKVSSNKDNQPKNKTALNQVEQIERAFQAVMFETQWIAVSCNCYDYNKILRNAVLVQLFGDNVMSAILDQIEQSAEIATMIRSYLASKQLAFKGLSPIEVYDAVFLNSKQKKKMGLVYVNFNLANKLIDKFSADKYNKKGVEILVVNALNGAIPIVLRERFPKAKIVCAEYFEYFTAHLTNLGFEVVRWGTLMNRKFDAVIGNPPYTQGTKCLYRYFVEKAVELSTHVCMIIPYKPESNYDSLKKLNTLISQHKTYVSENISEHFNVGLDNIHCIILDTTVKNNVSTYVNPLDSYVSMYPKRRRLSPIKGNTAVSDNKITVSSGTEILDKVLSSGPTYRIVPDTLVASATQKIKTRYAVFTNHTPSLGKFNTLILKDFKSTWSMSVFGYEVASKSEAAKLKSWLESKEIVNEIKVMLALKDTYAVTLEMLRKLPWYE